MNGVFDKIKAREIVLTDGRGRARIRLDVTKKGKIKAPRITMFNGLGKSILEIKQIENTANILIQGGLAFFDKSDKLRLTISTPNADKLAEGAPFTGQAAIAFWNENEDLICELKEDESGEVSVVKF
ncbi:hypothetical protein ACFL5K_06510 [Gemmatimonadota bacterium]